MVNLYLRLIKFKDMKRVGVTKEGTKEGLLLRVFYPTAALPCRKQSLVFFG
jgi:hypothetical protein